MTSKFKSFTLKTCTQLTVASITLSFLVACHSTNKSPAPQYYSTLSENTFSNSESCNEKSENRDDYASTYIGIGPCHDEISVSLFVSEPASSSPKTALDLSAEGQAAFIKRAKEFDNIHAVLAKPIKREMKKSSADDSAFTQTRKLTFTVATTKMSPADRITEAHLIATLPPGWEFIGWSGFSVVSSDVTAANVVDTLTNRFKASTGLGLDKFIEELINTSVEAERTRSTQVTSNLTFDVVEFLPRLTRNTAEFILSAPFQQVNLAGSYTVDVKLKYTGKTRVKNVELSGKGDRALIRIIQQGYIPDNDDVMSFSMPYVVRRSTGGNQRTLKEDDDKAIYMYVEASKDPKTAKSARDTQVAKIGENAPFGEEALGLKINQKQVSVMYLDRQPLKFKIPYNAGEIALCAVNRSGAKLSKLLQWIDEKPKERLHSKDSNGNLIHQLVKLDGVPVSNSELKHIKIFRKNIEQLSDTEKSACVMTFTH